MRFSMKTRKGLLHPFLLLVDFQTGDFGILLNRRLQVYNWKGINDWMARNSYSVKVQPCANLKNNISNKATAFWILLIAVLKMPNPKTLHHLKTCMIVIRDFAHLKEIRNVFPKKNSDLF